MSLPSCCEAPGAILPHSEGCDEARSKTGNGSDGGGRRHQGAQSAPQAGTGAQSAPQGGAAGAAGQGAGRGGQGGGRGAQNCPTPTIPAAESCISSQLGQANWPNPPLPDGPIMIQSALNQHRDLRVFILKGFNQPWSMAWLPDPRWGAGGTMLVTERGGRLRVVRNWVLDPTPVAGVPQVQAGGLQGLMDVVVHPRFAENRFVYLSYHKPLPRIGADGKPVTGARRRAGNGRRDDDCTGHVERIGPGGREGHLARPAGGAHRGLTPRLRTATACSTCRSARRAPGPT